MACQVFFTLLAQKEPYPFIGKTHKFKNLLNLMTLECIYVGYDSTNFNTNAYGIELADYGHPKVDEGLPQYNLGLCSEPEGFYTVVL